MINRQGFLLIECIVNLCLYNPTGDIDLVVLGSEVKAVNPTILARSLGPNRVANELKVIERVVLGEDMVQNQPDFLLIVEISECARFEVVEGIVGWSQDGEPFGGAVELVLDLGSGLSEG
ncbi:MAG: hypothetical protein Q8807_03595 ['Waltheria sp.' little leaf phytoplasma]|nr:hypothetical protein ['Waltheria sp.' little leaf phytoplasma]